MANLAQNLKTRISGLLESVKSWKTARGNEDYEDLESQGVEQNDDNKAAVKMKSSSWPKSLTLPIVIKGPPPQ